jgi:DNA polymerase III subunit gamma/tau
MKQALYRNYRPRSFKEVVGQDHITRTLERAIKNNRISHAYLFTGPRGVGKTSAARILAHSANGLPYESEAQHLDIIEIDAASNRRIDEIRDLRDKVRTAPINGKYKVYIIDEAHMLTREAFNALLKTLEEPPAHVIFILATTEAHKLPETIISRTQRFEFKPIEASQMAKHLEMIANSEKIKVTPGALALLAEFGGGSFRDSISLLDQLSGAGKITEEDVSLSLGVPSKKVMAELLSAVNDGDAGSVVRLIQSLKEQGVDAAMAARAIATQLRSDAINSQLSPYGTALLKQLIEVPASARPYDYLEVCLLEAASQKANSGPESRPSAQQIVTRSASAVKKIKRPAKNDAADFDISQWPAIVNSAKLKAASIYTALRLAQPAYEDGTLLLKFEYPLHQKKLHLAKNKDLVANLIEELIGTNVKIDCIVDKSAFSSKETEPPPKKSPQPNSFGHINNIFGSAEVVEA